MMYMRECILLTVEYFMSKNNKFKNEWLLDFKDYIFLSKFFILLSCFFVYWYARSCWALRRAETCLFITWF